MSEMQKTPKSNPGQTEVAVSEFPHSWSPEFIQELLPCAERTALLYQLSYLCLGGFPRLERIIRRQALETQMLFGSSEAILQKCVFTSSNLVSSLFPMLMKAVEKNKPNLAVKYLEKARAWISDIIRAVDDMVKRYDEQNRNVASCTSDVIQEKHDTEKTQQKNTAEIKSLEKAMEKLEEELKNNTKQIEETESKIEGKRSELQSYIQSVSKKSHRLNVLAALVPFVGPLIKAIHEAETAPNDAAETQRLNTDLSSLCSEKSSLQNKQWMIQIRQTELQLRLVKSKIELGVIPSSVHLKDVQQCLSRIQQILIQLKKFWEKVACLLDGLKEKTFVGEELIEDLDVLREEFLQSIETAGTYWQSFGSCCKAAQTVFSVQSRDAYQFLEISPSSLSQNQRNAEYKSVMEKLNAISPDQSPLVAITN